MRADAGQFGLKETKHNLASFLDGMPLGAPANDTAEGQSYVFGDQELERLSRDIGHLSFVNESEVSLDTFQFYVGPQASGAPVHFHGDAVNMLVYGAKHCKLHDHCWNASSGDSKAMVVRAGALLPPPIAQYSKLPAQQWFSDVLPRIVGDGGAPAPVVQCLQRAGEAIYVPAVSHRFSKRSTRTADSNSRFEQRISQRLVLGRAGGMRC